MRRLVLIALLWCAASRTAQAQPAPTPVARESLTVTLITFGQNTEVFERFGHNALWFHDNRTGEDIAYHWGLFGFNDPGFIWRFLTGDTNYSMGPTNPLALIEYERRAGRPITLSRLNLTPPQAQSLRDYVRWNELPANVHYRYDYFADNCSTRLRDAIDHSLGGALHRAFPDTATSMSYRRESVRLTDGDPPIQAGIDIALGRPADVPITDWQSFFIPMRLRDGLRHATIPDGTGAMVPIVAEEHAVPLYGPPNVVERAQSPRLAPRFLLLGLLMAALVVGLRIMAVSRRGAAWGLALFGAAHSLLSGLIGVILLLAWFATRHQFWARNENVLLLTPLSLALVILIPAAVLRWRAEAPTRILAALIAGMGIVAGLLAVLPGGQESRAVVALILPTHLALAWALKGRVVQRRDVGAA